MEFNQRIHEFGFLKLQWIFIVRQFGAYPKRRHDAGLDRIPKLS